MYVSMYGWMDGWMDGWIDRQTDRQIHTYTHTFVHATPLHHLADHPSEVRRRQWMDTPLISFRMVASILPAAEDEHSASHDRRASLAFNSQLRPLIILARILSMALLKASHA